MTTLITVIICTLTALVVYFAVIEPLLHEVKRQGELLDWAETLLCNSLPQPHCSHAEWSAIITNWRDQKHNTALDPDQKNVRSNVRSNANEHKLTQN